MSVEISISSMILLSISLPSLYQTTWGTGRPVMLQLSLRFSPALRVSSWSGDHSISGETRRQEEDSMTPRESYHIQERTRLLAEKLTRTALILGHDVSGGVGRWTNGAHSVPGDHSELKSVSRRQSGHSVLGLADVCEVAPQPFAPSLAPLHAVTHNPAAPISLRDVPLQGDRVSSHIDAGRSSRWIWDRKKLVLELRSKIVSRQSDHRGAHLGRARGRSTSERVVVVRHPRI